MLTQAVKWMASWITHHFYTTSTLIGVEGKGWWRATKWQVNVTPKVKTAKWHTHSTQNSYIYAWPHQPVIWWFIAGCLSMGMEPFNDPPSTCGRLTGLRNKAQQSSMGNFQHWYLSDILASVHVQLFCDGEKCRQVSQIYKLIIIGTCTASPFSSKTVISFLPIDILFISNKMMKQRAHKQSWLVSSWQNIPEPAYIWYLFLAIFFLL